MVRFAVPDGRGELVVVDVIRGDINFDAALIGDFVIFKSDGMPTYTLSNVVDDMAMQVTHVIRN